MRGYTQMSDSNEPIQSEESQEPKPIVLIIQVSPDGKIQINGPIANKLLCYSMLEGARDAVHEYHMNQNKIVKPTGGLINYLRNGKH